MITVIGLGYVGLTTAIGFSFKGIKTFGYEKDKIKLSLIKSKRLPFHEKDMQEVLTEVIDQGNFVPTSDLKLAVKNSEIIIFCVGTPSNSKGVDLRLLKAAIKEVLNLVDAYKVFVIRSTVPPGTAVRFIKKMIENEGFKVGEDIGLANNPEFLREGHAWADFVNAERIIIGVSDLKSGKILQSVYKKFSGDIYKVSLNTAEFIKYLSNTFLATAISFSNEMATFGEILGDIDIPLSFEIFHRDHRWSGHPANMTSYVYPGCGFGGSCLPKDTLAFIKNAESQSIQTPLLKAVLNINETRPKFIVRCIEQKLGGGLRNKNVSVLGLAFKPHTDDVRQTPSKPIIEQLIAKGANVKVYDSLAMDAFRQFKLKIKYAKSLKEAASGSDLVVILTAWEEFLKIVDFVPMDKILDCRYMLRAVNSKKTHCLA